MRLFFFFFLQSMLNITSLEWFHGSSSLVRSEEEVSKILKSCNEYKVCKFLTYRDRLY